MVAKTYYVGSGGDDAHDGLSWAERFLTLNGAENEPVAAGDTVYVAPGVYRELLTCDVSGGAGEPITYIGDVTGQNTDGIGGIVRVTGSDDDTTGTRANCIYANDKDYRTFTGFLFDSVTGGYIISCTGGTNWIVQDCVIQAYFGSGQYHVGFYGTATNNTIKNCLFLAGVGRSISYANNVAVDNSGNLVQNCIFIGPSNNPAIGSDKVGGITIKNCTFIDCYIGVRVQTALTAGQTVIVNNCTIYGSNIALQGTVAGEIVENYNNIYASATARTNVDIGANSTAYPVLFNPPILLSGFKFPWDFPQLSQWSALRAITGTGEATDDFYGMTRPATAAKNSWGAVQYRDMARSTAQAQAGTQSMLLADAGRIQFRVPTTNVETTFNVYCWWGHDYTGTLPQMVIKQPGVAATTVVDTGDTEEWNLLTATLTPAALPPYVIVELVSNNTAAAGADTACYFDSLSVV